MTQFWGRYALVLLVSGFCLTGVAQEKMTKQTTDALSESPPAATKKITGRLPRYFASVVDQKQRGEIYEIRASYRERMAELQKELAELAAEEMKDVEKVLTANQLQKLEGIRADAAARAAQRASGEKLVSKLKKVLPKSNAKTSTSSKVPAKKEATNKEASKKGATGKKEQG